MLDEDECQPLFPHPPDEGERRLCLGKCQPGHNLVEQQQLRLGRDAFGDFEKLAVLQRKRRRLRIGLMSEANVGKNAVGASHGSVHRQTQQRRCGDHVAHAHIGEDLHVKKISGHRPRRVSVSLKITRAAWAKTSKQELEVTGNEAFKRLRFALTPRAPEVIRVPGRSSQCNG